MEWAALTLALVLILGLALARALRDRQSLGPARAGDPAAPSRTRPGDPELTPEDAAELARELAAAERDGAAALEVLLDRRLRILTSRRIPLRAIRSAPGPHTGRLAFADSTVLLGRARRPGELYRLAIAVPEQSVTIKSWTQEVEGAVLHLVWGQEQAEVIIVGLDQAD